VEKRGTSTKSVRYERRWKEWCTLYGGKVHQQEKRKLVCPIRGEAQEGERRLRRVEEEEMVCMAEPQKVQQGWRRSSIEELRKRAEEYCGKGVPGEVRLLELGWCMEEVVVLYLTCEKCGGQECHVEDNRGQGVISRRKLKEIKWCGCMEKAVQSREAKAQQSSARSREPEGAAKEEVKERNIRRTFKILREVWLDIGIEKVDTYEGMTVKALLDSGATGMFMDKEMAQKYGFKMTKLERPLRVKNVNETENSRGKITHQVEVNVFYKNHMERMRMDVCNLGKTEVILGMPWLQAYNPEINWETGEVKMMRCLPLCGRNIAVKEDTE